jgi:hypothetical protein
MRRRVRQLKIPFPGEGTIRLPEDAAQEARRLIAQLIREVWSYEKQEVDNDHEREDQAESS